MALRPEHVGRAVAVLIGLLLWLLPAAAAAQDRVFLVPVGEGLREPAEREMLTPLLGTLGFRQISWIELADIEAHVSLVSVVDLRADTTCGGTVTLEDWSVRLESAQELVFVILCVGCEHLPVHHVDVDDAPREFSRGEPPGGAFDQESREGFSGPRW